MKIFQALQLIICCYVTQGQTIYGRIPLRDLGNPKYLNIYGLTLNDSIFIANNSTKQEQAKAFWVLPSGAVVKLHNPELENRRIIALESWGDSTYFYSLQQFDVYARLTAVVQNKLTASIVTSNRELVVTGRFVGLYHAGQQFYALSMSRRKDEFYLSEIEGLEKMNEKTFKSTLDLGYESPFNFVSENETMSPPEARSPNKIYQQGNFLYVTIDRTSTSNQTPVGTSILKFNLVTGESETGTIADYSLKQFRTYIEGNYVFKLTKDRESGGIITIYNLSDFSVARTMYIVRGIKIGKGRSIKKNFTETIDEESVWDAVSNNATPFITATAVDSANFVIQFGASHLATNSGAIFVPVMGVPMIIPTGSSASEDVDQYAYFNWDGKNEPTGADKPKTIMEIIDAYDVSLLKQRKHMTFRGYVSGNAKTFGIYHEMRSDYVDIRLFTIPE